MKARRKPGERPHAALRSIARTLTCVRAGGAILLCSVSAEKWQPTYGPPRLWLWLSVNFSDGSALDLYSDRTWTGAQGPTVHDGVYMGSISDHRWARPGWARAGFTDRLTMWVNATVMPSPLDDDGLFALQIMDPIRTPPNNLHVATSGDAQPSGVRGGDLIKQQGGLFHPKLVPGGIEGQVFDVGQNMAGWSEIASSVVLPLSAPLSASELCTPPVAVHCSLRSAGAASV